MPYLFYLVSDKFSYTKVLNLHFQRNPRNILESAKTRQNVFNKELLFVFDKKNGLTEKLLLTLLNRQKMDNKLNASKI